MTQAPSPRPLTPAKRVAFTGVLMFGVLLFCEILLRMALCKFQGAEFLRPQHMIRGTYPELTRLSHVGRETPHSVLLLGGSVLTVEYGSIIEKLDEELTARGVTNLVLDSVAHAAHSSRDSLFKYQAITSAYDQVVFYHGINETRANNCPPSVFRKDYRHYGFYEALNVYQRHRRMLPIFVIPYAVDFACHSIRQGVLPKKYISAIGSPPSLWLAHGADIKTKQAFDAHLRGIAELARARGDRLIVVTFAYHVPGDYSNARFVDQALDYSRHAHAIEIWGDPANVVKGIEAHNAVIRAVAAEREDVHLVDMEQAIPKRGEYFDDICHLSPKGCARFAQILAEELTALRVDAEARRASLPQDSAPGSAVRSPLSVPSASSPIHPGGRAR